MEKRLSFFCKATVFFLLILLLSLTVSPCLGKQPEIPPTDFEIQYNESFIQGDNYRIQGNFEKALHFFEKSLQLAQKNGSKKSEIESLTKLGLVYWNIGMLKDSFEQYAQALHLAETIQDKDKQEACLSSIKIYNFYQEGKGYRSSGNYEKSIENFSKAVELSRKIKSKEHLVKCLRQMSANHWETGNFQKFFSLNEEAINIAKELNHKQEEGRCLNNIGLFFWKLDNYSEALKHYEKAYQIAKLNNNLEEEANCYRNIGAIYVELGDYDKALDYLTKALEIDEKQKAPVNISRNFNNIGEIYRRKSITSNNKDHLWQAIDYFEKSLAIADKTENIETQIKVLNNMGAAYSDLEKFVEALDNFSLAIKIAEKIQNNEEISILLNNMGIAFSRLGNYEESTKYYQKAIDLALEIRGGQILWEAYLESANTHVKQEQYDKALDMYKRSIGVIEDIRSQINLEELKATYLGTDKRMNAYHNLIDLFVRLSQSHPEKAYHKEAFSYLERAKARAFLDSLEVSGVSISEGISAKLLNREKELMSDISRLYTRLLVPQLTIEQKTSINSEMEVLETQLGILKREIRETSPAYANLKYPETITLEEAQNEVLDSQTAFYVYSIAPEKSYAFVVSKKNLKVFPIPPAKKIQSQVSEHLKSITDAASQEFLHGHELFEELVRPGLDEDVKKIVFVPDDILYFLPFETLSTKETGTEWLISQYKISYAPSLSSLRELIRRKRENRIKTAKDMLAFGDPVFGENEFGANGGNGGDILQNFSANSGFRFFRLAHSRTEVEKIAAFFKPDKRDIYLRENASEDILKAQNLSDYKIIHFATHGLIDAKKPARSSIILRLDLDPKEDGFLQMREVFNLKLNADLVSLSACQTGLGQLIRGEGIEGLNRAFFYAGASSVLMSLWATNDQASSQLMERFYSHLHSSESIANALRKAKLEMIQSGILVHPYYWAGFIASGDADAIIFPTKRNLFLLAFFSLCAVFVIALSIKNLNKKI